MAELFQPAPKPVTPCRDANELAGHLALRIIKMRGEELLLEPYKDIKEAIYGVRPTKRGLSVALLVHAKLKNYPEKAALFVQVMFFKQRKLK